MNADYGSLLHKCLPKVIEVWTKDCNSGVTTGNAFADRGFHLVVFASPPVATPAGASPVAAIAGARVNASGTVVNWFNDLGGAPLVTHTAGSGLYDVNFPNVPNLASGHNTVLSVTP